MKQFKVFHHPSYGYEAVKQGWSWPGFLFGPVWALVKKLWFVAIAVSLFTLAVAHIMSVFAPPLVPFASLIPAILVGIVGNQERAKSLSKRGFSEIGIHAGASADQAIAEAMKPAPAPGSPS